MKVPTWFRSIYVAVVIGIGFHSGTVFGIGQPAPFPPQIQGLDLNNGKYQTVLLNKVKLGTVVVFLSSVCPCSHSHISALNLLAQEYSNQGFAFVGVHSNANESIQQASEYFKKAKLLFPVIQDDGSHLADQFRALKTPHAYIINPKLETVFQGGIDDSRNIEKAKRRFLKEALEAIRLGRPPQDTNVRVLGCEIRRP